MWIPTALTVRDSLFFSTGPSFCCPLFRPCPRTSCAPFGNAANPWHVKTPTGCGKPTCVPISLRQFSPMKAFSTSIWRRACLLMTSWIISRNTCGFFPAFTACSAPLTAWRLTGWKCRPNWRWLAPATCTLSGAIPWPLRLPKIPT